MFEKITEAEINERSMANVSTTPGRKTAFGESNLNAQALKLRFDRLSRYLAGRINEILEGIDNGALVDNLQITTDDKKISLGDFIHKLLTGDVSDVKIQAYDKVMTLEELAIKFLQIYDGVDSGDLAARMKMKDGESFQEFYDLAKAFVMSDRDEIVKIILSKFTEDFVNDLATEAAKKVDLSGIEEALEGRMLSVNVYTEPSYVMQDIITAIQEAGGDVTKVNFVSFTGFTVGCYAFKFTYYGGNTYNIQCADFINSKRIYNPATNNTGNVTTTLIREFLSYAIDCRTEIVESLETEDKTVVGGINEVNAKTFDKIKSIDTCYDDTYNLDADSNGVFWKDRCAFATENTESTADIYFKVPIAAGEGISFEVDQENQVVKINAEEGSQGYDDSTIGIWIFNENISFDGVEYGVEFPINFTSLGITQSLNYVLFETDRYAASGNFIIFGNSDYSKVIYSSVAVVWLSVGWQDKRHRTIVIQDELEDGWFKTWLKANAKKYVGYQCKYDSALDTDSKDIVGAINEINAKSVDKIDEIYTAEDDFENLEIDEGGIRWSQTFGLYGNDVGFLNAGYIGQYIPLVAGDNVTFTVDEENRVLKINSTGGGAGLPTVTTDDNGKFLRVVGGSWATASVPNAEGATF